MGRGLSVLLIAFGAVIAWAGYSDNTVRDVLGATVGRKPTAGSLSTSGTLNKGAAGLDRVVIFAGEYYAAKIGGSLVGGAAGILGGGAALASAPTPAAPAAPTAPQGTFV